MKMDKRDELRKFRGPTFNAMVQFAAMNKHSLIQEVKVRSPAELAAIVVGVSVFEVFKDMPQCNILIHAMEKVKKKQARVHKPHIIQWMNANLASKEWVPVMNQHTMRKMDMRLFLARFPLSMLPNSVFKPFISIVKNFLLTHLYKFRRNRMLYKHPPELPREEELPYVINAFGTMEYLERNFPNLARLKHEMIINITHFTITYCVDWICEVLTLRADNSGFVTYSYSAIIKEANKPGGSGRRSVESLRSDPEFFRKRRAISEVSDHDENYQNTQVEVETATNQPRALMEIDTQLLSPHVGDALPCGDHPLSMDSSVQDDWSEMLEAALVDPNLPTQYKTMIRCLVTSNRDLRNIVNRMKSKLP